MDRKAKNIQIYIKTTREIDRTADWLPTDRYIGRQAGQQVGRQKERQTDRQTDRKTYFEIFTSTVLYFFCTVNTVCMYYIHIWY